jgi:hypothetical protein
VLNNNVKEQKQDITTWVIASSCKEERSVAPEKRDAHRISVIIHKALPWKRE